MKEFDVEKSTKGQAEYCKKKGYPLFAPANGICWNCKRNIYKEIIDQYGKSGHDVEKANSELITGCPHCHRSYCE